MKYDIKLNNQSLPADKVPAIVDFSKLQIKATFDDMAMQPNISTSTVTFANEAAQIILDYIDAGLSGGTGVTEGCQLSITLTDGANTYTAFDGCVDFMDGFKVINCQQVEAKIKKTNGLNNLSEHMQAITWGHLYTIGLITDSDFVSIPYVYEVKEDLISYILLLLIIAQIIMLIVQMIKDLVAFEGIAPAQNTLAATIATRILILAAESLQAAFMVVMLIKVGAEFADKVVPRKFYHRGFKVKIFLQRACTYLGLNFVSSIGELEYMYYLPIKNSKGKTNSADTTETGYPGGNEQCYTVAGLFRMCMDQFYAKIVIRGNTLYLEPVSNRSFWESISTYQMPDVLTEGYQINTDELAGVRLIRFTRDDSDYWSIEDNSYSEIEVKTEYNYANIRGNVLIKGLDDIMLPVALGSRKDQLSDVETVFDALISAIISFQDTIGTVGMNIGIFTSATAAGSIAAAVVGMPLVGSLALTAAPALSVIYMENINTLLSYSLQQYVDKVGCLRLASHDISVPKVLMLDSASDYKLYSAHRAMMNAQTLYINYHAEKSFVANNYSNNQWKKQTGIQIPFCFSNFLQLINSGWGRLGTKQIKIDSLEWNFDEDRAIIDYRYRETYTKGIKETINIL